MAEFAFKDIANNCHLCNGHALCSLHAGGSSMHVRCASCREFVITAVASVRLGDCLPDYLRTLSVLARRSNTQNILLITRAAAGSRRLVRADLVPRRTLKITQAVETRH